MLLKYVYDATAKDTPEDQRFSICRYVPEIDRDLKWGKIYPHIETAEWEYLVPNLGEELLEGLEGEVENEPQEGYLEVREKLKGHVLAALANFTALVYSRSASVKLGAMGTVVNNSADGTVMQAGKWMKIDSRKSFFMRGMSAMDRALGVLAKGASFFPEWKDGGKRVIPTPTVLAEHMSILKGRHVVFHMMKPWMKDAEKRLVSVMGKLTLLRMIEGATEQARELREMSREVVSKALYIVAVPFLMVRVTQEGVVEMDYTEDGEPQKQLRSDMVDKLAQKAENAITIKLKEIESYLNANADSFPEYKESGLYTPVGEGDPFHKKFNYENGRNVILM